MMCVKNIYIIIWFCLFANICYAQKDTGFKIKGEFKGLKNNTYVFLIHNKPERNGIDTMARSKVVNEQFEFSGFLPLEGEDCFIIIDDTLYEKKIPKIPILLENRNVQLNGSIDKINNAKSYSEVNRSIAVTGLPSHIEFVEYQSRVAEILVPINVSVSEAIKEYAQTSDYVKYQNSVENAMKPKNDFIKNWLSIHQASLLAPWVIYKSDMNIYEKDSFYLQLEMQAQNSFWGRILSSYINVEKQLNIGSLMPDFIFPDFDGKLISIKDIRKNKKVIIIDFWASWCGPCLTKFPYTKQTYETYKNAGLEIIGFSIDKEEQASNWRSLIISRKLPWVHVRETVAGFAKNRYSIDKIPSNLIVDKNGIILGRNLFGKELHEKLRTWLYN